MNLKPTGLIQPRLRVSLTARDIQLFELLYHSVALSFPHVGRKVFPGKNKSTVLNRLGKLERANFIRRLPVHGVVLRSSKRGRLAPIKGVYQLTPRGLSALSKGSNVQVERDEPIRIQGHTLTHDLLLVDLADALRTRLPEAQITDGRLWPRSLQAPELTKPDLVLVPSAGQKPWAIELELTPKSDRRYREIILRYRLSREFERVVYVTDSRQIVARLTKLLEGRFAKFEPTPGAAKFTYLALWELLERVEAYQLDAAKVTEARPECGRNPEPKKGGDVE